MFPSSHPCECAEAALRLKRISYTRVNLIPAFHKLVVRSHFPSKTVPALALGNERIIGSRAILRRLDELEPVPRLIPEDPELRARVEEAEAWGDHVLQPLVRRVAWAGLRRNTDAMLSYATGAKMPLPRPLLKLGARPVAAMACRYTEPLTSRRWPTWRFSQVTSTRSTLGWTKAYSAAKRPTSATSRSAPLSGCSAPTRT